MDEDVELVVHAYAADPSHRSVRIDGIDPATGEPVSTFTVFAEGATPKLDSNKVILKDYSENEGYPESLVAAGLGKIVGPAMNSLLLPSFLGVILEVTSPELLALMAEARKV
jgi:hypothetical protein